MQEVERSAPTVEEALEAALAELGVSRAGGGRRDRPGASIRFPRNRRAGGCGSRARANDQRSPEDEEDLDEQAEVAADFLEGLLEKIGIVAEVDVNDVDGVTYVEIWADDDPDALGLLIGKRGNTLESIQELVRIVVHRVDRGAVLRSSSTWRTIASDAEPTSCSGPATRPTRVKKSGRQEALEPMSAYERKLVHDAVAEIGGLQTASEGEEPERRVVIHRAG